MKRAGGWVVQTREATGKPWVSWWIEADNNRSAAIVNFEWDRGPIAPLYASLRKRGLARCVQCFTADSLTAEIEVNCPKCDERIVIVTGDGQVTVGLVGEDS